MHTDVYINYIQDDWLDKHLQRRPIDAEIVHYHSLGDEINLALSGATLMRRPFTHSE